MATRYKVWVRGSQPYIARNFDDFMDFIKESDWNDFIEDYKYETVEMSDYEYDQLPEFQGF